MYEFCVTVMTNGNWRGFSAASETMIWVKADNAPEAVIKAMQGLDKEDIVYQITVTLPCLPDDGCVGEPG